MNANEKLRDAAITHDVYLRRYTSALVLKSMDDLIELEKVIDRELRSLDFTNITLYKETDQALKVVKQEIEDRLSDLQTKIEDELAQLGEYEALWQKDSTEEASYYLIPFLVPTIAAISAKIASTPFLGKTTDEWFTKLIDDSFTRVRDSVRMGVVEGETSREIVDAVIGTKKLNYTDGIVAGIRNQTDAIVDTATAHALNTARDAFYEANSEHIDTVQWVSVLDMRTSSICQSLDGKIFPVDSGQRPPAHVRCRSSMSPVLKSIDLGTPAMRDSMDGKVPATETYQSWLKKKPAKFQDEVLGKSRGELFRAGGLSLDRFVDSSGHKYTLDELKIIESKAFKRAKIDTNK
ncbi:MAG: phage head morphogenesis protein [Dehalococcoidia bacterium]|nr:phage head morphogenesis protein [Dehalococcoidia bacterium]|tara:strand:- start:4592 stop:5641 length:1050 start_codon:yes stop_codon:yes gene_type:complete